MNEEKEIQHVIALSVSDVDELPIGPQRYIRTVTIRSLLGEELVLRLHSENRLGLTLEHERENTVVPKPHPQRRKDDAERSKPD